MKSTKRIISILMAITIVSSFSFTSISSADQMKLDIQPSETASIYSEAQSFNIELEEYIASGDLVFREDITLKSEVIGIIPKGNIVKYIEVAANDFIKVEYEGKLGYIQKDIFEEISPENIKNDEIKIYEVDKEQDKEFKVEVKDIDKDQNKKEVQQISKIKDNISDKTLKQLNHDLTKPVKSATQTMSIYEDKDESNEDKDIQEEIVKDPIVVGVPDGNTYITLDDLELREGNSTEYTSLIRIPKGTELSHMGTTSNGWFKLSYKGNTGYANKYYMTSKSSQEYEITTRVNYSTTTSLNMRSGSSVKDKLLVKIPKGRRVQILNINKGWAKIKYALKEGYVNANYLIASRPALSKSDNVKLNRIRTTAQRTKIVNASLLLVDKVPYFWGGKSYKTGWNGDWNKLRKITSPGTSNTGKYLPYGLDCSGFIDWTFRSAGLGNIFSKGGTAYQWSSSKAITRENARPGDVVFKQSPSGKGINHIGVYVGKDVNGQELVVHSSYGRGGVVITTLENSGLKHFRRAKNLI
nr:SH3 domain-containing protein [Tissierella sp.]